MKKIKINEFLKSKSIMAIHVTTEQQAKMLCEVFHSYGKEWSNGESFLNNYKFKFFENRTCYLNLMKFVNIERLEEINCEIFEFDQVKLNNYEITLDEYWGSEEVLGIRVTTEKNDELLRQAFHNFGKKWRGGKSYLEMTPFKRFGGSTNIVYRNDCQFSAFGSSEDIQVYDFDQVDLGKYSYKSNENSFNE